MINVDATNFVLFLDFLFFCFFFYKNNYFNKNNFLFIVFSFLIDVKANTNKACDAAPSVGRAVRCAHAGHARPEEAAGRDGDEEAGEGDDRRGGRPGAGRPAPRGARTHTLTQGRRQGRQGPHQGHGQGRSQRAASSRAQGRGSWVVLVLIEVLVDRLKLKLNPCTNLGVFVQVYPTGVLFT